MEQFKPSTINIIHYHFHTGGVTNVIIKIIQTLLESKKFSYIKKIILFTGSKKNIIAIRNILNTTKVEIRYKKFLGYLEWLQKDTKDNNTKTNKSFVFKNKKKILTQLLNFFTSYNDEKTLWWIHNYHLGKNNLFTFALLQFIKKYNPYTLLHIHDFPEQTRFKALEKLISLPGEDKLYDFNSQTIVAVINEYDKKILKKASLETHLLPNIVTHKISQKNKIHKLTSSPNSLKKYIAQKQNFDAQYINGNYLLFTYPVRCIRRKNILEAMLITKMIETRFAVPCVFNITLPGESEQEKRYSEIVEKLIYTKKVTGIFSLGKQKDCPFSFQEICNYSDAIISSSVLEGFGFSYLDSVLYNSPLIARSIAQSKKIEDLFSLYWPSIWYKNINIPYHIIQSLPSIISYNLLYFAYKTKIEKLPEIVDNDYKENLISSIKYILKQPTIDFSFLIVTIQEYLLNKFDTFKKDIVYANTKLLKKIYNILLLFTHSRKVIEKYRHIEMLPEYISDNNITDKQNNNQFPHSPSLKKIALQVISKHYGKKVFIQSFENILKHINSTTKNKKSNIIFHKILHQHLSIENFRLLYDEL